MSSDPFSEFRFYLHRRHEPGGKVYTFYTEFGAPRFVAEVAGIPKDIWFRRPERTGLPLLVLKAWRYFPVNGKYDVFEYDGGPRLGILHRAGNIYDNAEKVLGHINDPTPAGEHVKGGLIEAVAGAVLSGDDGSVHSRPPQTLQLLVGREVGGVFRPERLPFSLPGQEGFSPARFVQQFLPEKAQAAVESFIEPRGWQLDLWPEVMGKLNKRLLLAAALFHIELQRLSGS